MTGFPRNVLAAPGPRLNGVSLWCLRHRDARIEECELRETSNGFDVVIYINGMARFARRCVDRDEADYVAGVLRQYAINAGGEPFPADFHLNQPTELLQ